MTLKDFLKSKVFFKQLAIAFGIVCVTIFLILQYLAYATNHGQEIPVPDLRKMNLEKAEETLDGIDLEYVVLDTVDFRADFPPYTIVQQDPLPKANVKDGRKIYVKLNSAGYATITLPDIIQRTYRAALPALKTVGLEEGKKTYKPYLAKDVVLEVWQNGKKLKKGDKVLKASKIDLVLGDGKTGYVEESDTVKAAETQKEDE
ncbi:PASTA domain-containing protein [Flavobacterium sp. DG1-102-2]|uniref:PASTA domain-containing protein n=1 Tax=Flavobacterium sp. DG1-102-2 TaxID=3081663 RepID=UPI0029498686|nr:PASTA domain-containing protein [Flavobacterium sp. DG1-102-2]MDV6168733.1 PASTA domain-containing protein [Flavobacterium sp. DG1-102-2]